METNWPVILWGRAPIHDGGETRVLVKPGPVCTFDGDRRYAPLVVGIGRPDGNVEVVFRGSGALRAASAAAETVRERRPDAVWLTDRSYVRRHYSDWTVERVESRLAAAAADADAAFRVWTGS